MNPHRGTGLGHEVVKGDPQLVGDPGERFDVGQLSLVLQPDDGRHRSLGDHGQLLTVDSGALPGVPDRDSTISQTCHIATMSAQG